MSVIEHFLAEEQSDWYPDRVNRAIVANRLIAESGDFIMYHTNANHTEWHHKTTGMKIHIGRCDGAEVLIYE
jgi:hypothetical protein